MNKIILLSLIFVFLFTSCDKRTKTEKAIEAIPVEIKINRFDKAFFETPAKDLPQLKIKYPLFFPEGNDDAVWLQKMQDPQWKELYSEVQKKYPDFQPEKAAIETLFKHINYYFPEAKVPEIYTVIGDMDYKNKVIYSKGLLIICLELYLGKDHKFYEFPEYLKQNFTQDQILPDVVDSYFYGKIALPKDNTLLSQMIYAGKELYLKDILLPKASDAVKMGYTPEQITWSQENEAFIWSYFIEKQLLFDTDQKLNGRFISQAPFSKFYLEIDNESPGRLGAWIGWQIVRSFMKNNEQVTLLQLLQMDGKEIFEKSKYKPKK